MRAKRIQGGWAGGPCFFQGGGEMDGNRYYHWLAKPTIVGLTVFLNIVFAWGCLRVKGWRAGRKRYGRQD
jgi:hypothetical protein